MTQAWNKKQRDLPHQSEPIAKEQIRQIKVKVLSNRRPPYSLTGGVYDALTASSGFMYSVTNSEIENAMALFEKKEKIDLHPAGGAALGSLIQALERKYVDKTDVIALNITGGGEKRIKRDYNIHYLRPFARFTDREIHSDDMVKKIESILAVV